MLRAPGVLSGAFPSERLAAARKDPLQWHQLLDLERRASLSPGCLDMGAHLIVAATFQPITAKL
jgi:hypothetical protein